MTTKTKNSMGFAHVEILMVTGVLVLIGLAGWFVFKNRNAETKQENQVTKSTPAPSTKKTTQTTVKLDEKAVTELAQTTSKTTPAPSKSTTSTTSTPATSNPAPASTTPAPSYSITISSDGCSVSGYSVPGNHIEIGAFSGTKGGSVVYDITSNQTITKSSGGFKGMTAFGRTTDAQGNVLAYHSAPITADSCPAAG